MKLRYLDYACTSVTLSYTTSCTLRLAKLNGARTEEVNAEDRQRL